MLKVKLLEDKQKELNTCNCCLGKKENAATLALYEVSLITYGSEFSLCLCKDCITDLITACNEVNKTGKEVTKGKLQGCYDDSPIPSYGKEKPGTKMEDYSWGDEMGEEVPMDESDWDETENGTINESEEDWDE